MFDERPQPWGLSKLVLLVWLHVVVCCGSLLLVLHGKFPGFFDAAEYHLFLDLAQLYPAVAAAAAFALLAPLFAIVEFSFGYYIGFYFFTMILSYLWLNSFSDLFYNHRLAGFSAAVSAVTFLLPALLITSPIRQIYILPERRLEQLLKYIVILSVATIAIGAFYNFRLVSLDHIYDFRDQLKSPRLLNYLIGITSTVLLPFAFACLVERKAYWMAGAMLLLLLLFYPITLNKIAFFTPAWLVAITLVSRIFEARMAVVLSLFLPTLIGVVLIAVFPQEAAFYFYLFNFRTIAIPASAMDIYSDYFSQHAPTYFCQIWILKSVISCPVQDPLSIVMSEAYGLGNFNASLFATEGVASVGVIFAPFAVLLCGLVAALGNRLSVGLPPRFIMMSGAVLPPILLNVPLTTTLLTHGAAVLFLLWYIMPRSIFRQPDLDLGKRVRHP